MSDATFVRSKHDRQNPYLMISREMLQDKSISPKAKGVLCYLLSLPNDWIIYHAQLQQALGVGEDYLNSAMQELITEGYATRTRNKIKGVFQPYQYEFRELKICLPDRVSRAGLAGPENPALLSNIEHKKEIQTPISPKRGPRFLKAEKRKEWSLQNQQSSQCGYSTAEADRYVIVSGSCEESHYYARRDPFWEKIGL